MSPCVSVIVTTFNRVILLAKTLESILSQTFTDFELIVIDNMSQDDTFLYVNSLVDSRVRYYKNANNGIIAINRNFGIKQAKGKYIAFCDDDDIWLPDKLKEQIFVMERHPEIALCYTHAESFMGDTVISAKMNNRTVHENHFRHLLRGNFFPNSSVLIRSDVFCTVGLLNEDPLLREDYEMWLRVAKQYRLQGIDASLIRYRIHPGNVAGNRASETLRAIRTIRSVARSMNLPLCVIWPNVGFQFLKYCWYRLASLRRIKADVSCLKSL